FGANPTTAASNIVIQGNYFGVGPDGTTTTGFSNDAYAILDQGNNNIIGGTTAAARNVIPHSGHNAPTPLGETRAGVAVHPTVILGLSGSTPTGNIIEGNYIGVGADGSTPAGNNIGVLVGLTTATSSATSSTTVGGTALGAGNVISDNTTDGIEVVE